MSDNTDRISQALVAILKMADDQAGAGLSKTALVKYAYLLDVFTAEDAGKPWSGADWRFVHFGPFAGEVADAISKLRQQGVLLTTGEDVGSDRDFTIFRYNDSSRAQSLTALGISATAALQLAGAIKRFGNNLSRLLDYVYFHTTPMVDAQPKSRLDFSACEPLDRASFRRVQISQLSARKVKKAHDVLRKAVAERKAAHAAIKTYWAPYDEAYFAAERALDRDEGQLPVEIFGRAVIDTP